MADVTHASLTDPDLHEPKGIAAASAGQVYEADGAGSGAWTTPAAPVFMNKHIAGLTYQNGSGDPTNDITILAGTARDTTNTEDITLSASITKRLDAAWAVGDTNGGLDTGAIANTTYHIWLIKRTDTDVVDALFSTSATAPTMPANYDKKRRIGSFQRIAAAIQTVTIIEVGGGGIEVVITPTETSCGSPASTGTNYTLTGLPTGVRFQTILGLFTNSIVGTEERFFVTAPDATINLGTLSATSMGSCIPTTDSGGDTITYKAGTAARVISNTSGQIKIASNNASQTYTTTLAGWLDFRRD